MTQENLPRLGASSASLPTLSPEHLVEHLAREGYQGVEWRVASIDGLDSGRPWDARTNNRCTVAPTAKAIDRIYRHCQSHGITIFGLSPYLEVGDIDNARLLIDLASQAGQARLRLWGPGYQHQRYAVGYSRMRRFLDDIVPLAENSGIQLALEVHQRTICSSPSLAMRVAEHYPAQQLGIIYDLGNLAIEGREDVQLSLDLMGDYLAHVQVKNVAYVPQGSGEGWSWEWCPPDAGVLPLKSMLSTLRNNGFDDWISIEDFDASHSDVLKLSRNRDLVSRYMNMTTVASETSLEVPCQ